MLDFEYALFSGDDPIALLKSEASKISIHKRFKIAPYIRRASALCRQSKKFADLIRDDVNPNNTMIGITFCAFFGDFIDKGGFVVISRDVARDYASYVKKRANVGDDKYMKRMTNLILAHSDQINAFVKAFHSVRVAQGEIDKLKTA